MKQRKFERNIPKLAVESLRQALGENLVAVVLFGSRARGDAREMSDWDLLVIAKGLPERTFQRHLLLKQALPPNIRGAISILAKTPEEFESHLSSLYLDIALDGQINYDPYGCAAGRLASLRQMIKSKGLYRERTEAGDLWRWEREPSETWSLEWEI